MDLQVERHFVVQRRRYELASFALLGAMLPAVLQVILFWAGPGGPGLEVPMPSDWRLESGLAACAVAGFVAGMAALRRIRRSEGEWVGTGSALTALFLAPLTVTLSFYPGWPGSFMTWVASLFH